jgi:dihydroneopterin aldolase
MMDVIHVHNLQFVGFHGVYDDERAEGRRFAMDIDVETATDDAGRSDALGDTVDYRDVAQVAVDVMTGESVHLIETLAERICAGIFSRLLAVQTVRICMRKYATGVPGDPEWVGLSIERRRPSD